MDLPGINAQVIETARTWIGTPYRHQAHLKGVGCDCIGLIIGVWQDLYGYVPDDFVLPPYSRSWAEETQLDLMTQYCKKYLNEVYAKDRQPGDVLLYRMIPNGPTKHAGILASTTTMIHALYNHTISEAPLITNAGAALTGVFRYPLPRSI